MKPVYLKHPIHGSKVATSQFEIDHDKEHGWEVYDPEAKPAKAPKKPVEPVIETPVTPAPVVPVEPVEPVIETPVTPAPVVPVEPVIETPAWLVVTATAQPEQEPAPKKKGGRPPKNPK